MIKQTYTAITLAFTFFIGIYSPITANSITVTYTSGNIPTNYNTYSPSCNGPSSTMSINIPTGSLVTSIDINYNMTAGFGAWKSEQVSGVHCQETGNTEIESYGLGNSSGTHSYSRTGVTIANGISVTGDLTFEMRAIRTWGTTYGNCDTQYNKIDNNTWTITVNYIPLKSPGNISKSKLNLWLKADEQTNCITNNCAINSWGDNTINLNNASQNTALNQPNYIVSANNYNPGINYNQSNQEFMSISDNNSLDLSNNHSIFIVSELDLAVDGFISTLSKHNSSYDNGGYGFHAFYSDAPPYYNASDLKTTYNVNLDISTPVSTAAQTDAVINGKPNITLGQYNGSEVSLTKNAGEKTSTPYTTSIVSNNSPLVIGADHDNLTVSSHFDGRINEAIVFDRQLTLLEQRKVETYLAVKYGITLDNTLGGTYGDYISTSGSVVWDASNNTPFHYDIIALARDDAELLNQKQSKTDDDSTKVYISNLTATNQLNSGAITNNESYLIIGHNNSKLSADLTIEQEAPSGIFSRILREWKITNTNFTDNYTIEIKLKSPIGSIDITDLRVLADTDDNFTDASILTSPTITVSSGSIKITGIGTSEIPANSTRYITLASINERTPLPIELLDFSVLNIDNKYAKINWSTVTEINNSHFIIEKSKNTSDWKEVIKISGANNSNQVISYQTFDKTPYKDLSYYRLKQVDYDGEFSYSELRTVTFKDEKEVRIYPNPTSGMISLINNSGSNQKLEIYNLIGQNITSQVLINYNNEKTTIDMNNLTSGNYIIRVNNKSYKISKI